MAISKPGPLYKLVAAEMRTAIANGDWPPGSRVPPEDQLCTLYDVSRPTIRQAVASLRTEGLVDVRQGHGTFVRTPAEQPAVLDLTVLRQGDALTMDPGGQWTGIEPPTRSRLHIDANTADRLRLSEGQPGFCTEQLLQHRESGTRATHSMTLPMERITGTPLAKHAPHTPVEAYNILAETYDGITWGDAISARMPNPDERSTLHLPEGVPVIALHRTTYSSAGTPLMLETMLLGADRTQVLLRHHAPSAV